MENNNSQKHKVILKAQEGAQTIIDNPSLKKALEGIGDMRESIQRAMKPFVDTMTSFNKAYQPDFLYREPLIFPLPPRPVTYPEVQHIVKKEISKIPRNTTTDNIEIVFTKDKELVKNVAGKKFLYAFAGGKKRLKAFEALLRNQGEYIETDILRRLAASASDQSLRKIVQGINRQARLKLDLKNPLIEHRRGFGYRISKRVKVIKE